jgi:hypothetical protein
MTNLTKARISTTKRTAGAELPACFVDATLASAERAIDRSRPKATVRRAVTKALRAAGVQ